MKTLDISFISGRDRSPGMSLNGIKLLLDDGESIYSAYLPILTTRILGALQRFTMAVGNNSGGIHNTIPHARNESVGVCDIVMSSGNGCICPYCKFLLEIGG